jgi:transposase
MPRILRAPESQIVSIEFVAAEPRDGYARSQEATRMSNIIAFPDKPAPVETECLPDHIGAKQAKMLLALFELKDKINDLTRLVESGQHIAKPSVGSEQISA